MNLFARDLLDSPYDPEEVARGLREARRVLAGVADLLSERSAFTKRAMGRDRHSRRVDPTSDRCVRRCVLGAIAFVEARDFGVPFDESIDTVWMLRSRRARIVCFAFAIEGTEHLAWRRPFLAPFYPARGLDRETLERLLFLNPLHLHSGIRQTAELNDHRTTTHDRVLTWLSLADELVRDAARFLRAERTAPRKPE